MSERLCEAGWAGARTWSRMSGTHTRSGSEISFSFRFRGCADLIKKAPEMHRTLAVSGCPVTYSTFFEPSSFTTLPPKFSTHVYDQPSRRPFTIDG